jgi:two-component system, cell cycle sensor histidine kinase and response regulator CckA
LSRARGDEPPGAVDDGAAAREGVTARLAARVARAAGVSVVLDALCQELASAFGAAVSAEIADVDLRWTSQAGHDTAAAPAAPRIEVVLVDGVGASGTVVVRRAADVLPVERAWVATLAELAGVGLGRARLREEADRQAADRDRKHVSEVQRMAHIVASSPGAPFSFRVGADGRMSFPFVSPQFEAMTGLSAEALAQDGAAMFVVIHPEFHGLLVDAIEASRRSLDSFWLDLRALAPEDGAYHWFEARSTPRAQSDGGVLWYGFLARIDDRKAVEAELRATRERFETLFRLSPIGMLLVRERDRLIVEANDAYLRMRGLDPATREQMLPLELPRLTTPAVRAGIWAELEQSGAVRDTQYDFYRADGSVCQARLFSQRLSAGGETFALTLIHDVTDRERAQQALAESEARFRELADSIDEVFWLTELPAAHVLYVSPAYETIWGVSRQSLYDDPRSWLAAIHPEDRERVGAAIARVRTEPYKEEYRIIRPDGSIRRVRDRAVVVRVREDGGFRLAGIAEDVTQRRELEERLRHAQKVEAIGQVAGGVAHDFNNLLSVISSCIEPLLKGSASPEHERELLMEIRQAVDGASSLTRQLLAFARRDVTARKVLDLNELVRETERMLRRVLREDVELQTDLARERAMVRVDPGLFQSAIVNLAVNARDAMPKGGELGIKTRIEVTADGGRWVVLEVKDKGAGMTPEVRARIFEPFYTTKGGGTGLGLAVVREIVHQNGGRIDVASAPGAGSTFRIEVPAHAEPAPPPAPAPPSALGTGGKETILLVEDQPLLRKAAARALRGHGYAVIEAGNGMEALRVLDTEGSRVDLILTDVVMPELGGRDLAEAAEKRLPGVKIVYASGYADDEVLRDRAVSESIAFLQKPYNPEALLSIVRSVLDAPARQTL